MSDEWRNELATEKQKEKLRFFGCTWMKVLQPDVRETHRGHRPAQFHRPTGGNRQRCKPPTAFNKAKSFAAFTFTTVASIKPAPVSKRTLAAPLTT